VDELFGMSSTDIHDAKKIAQPGKIRNSLKELLWLYKMKISTKMSCLDGKSIAYTLIRHITQVKGRHCVNTSIQKSIKGLV
jgi:hypothetical protein